MWLETNKKPITLTVLNGTLCDTFYEVVDALTVNPEIVKMILGAVDSKLDTERKHNRIKYEQSLLVKGVDSLRLPELFEDRPMSIFDIAAAYKATMPPDEFILDQGVDLLETALETLHEQIGILCPESERGSRFVALFEDQLGRFIGNIDLYREKYPSVIDDYTRWLLHVAITTLTNKGFAETAEKVNELSERYFSSDAQPEPVNAPPQKEAEQKDE
jgi:hypothetical protein